MSESSSPSKPSPCRAENGASAGIAADSDDPPSPIDDDPWPDPADASADGLQPTVELHLNTNDVEPPALGWIESRLNLAIRYAVAEGESGADSHAQTEGDPPPSVPGHIDLTLVDDETMIELHTQSHNDPTTTDVITFDLRDEPVPGQPTLLEADLILCVDVAQREAAARGHDVRTELLLYAVHGMLHLLGEDDLDPESAARMHVREDRLLRAIGIGSVYDRPNAGGQSAEPRPHEPHRPAEPDR